MAEDKHTNLDDITEVEEFEPEKKIENGKIALEKKDYNAAFYNFKSVLENYDAFYVNDEEKIVELSDLYLAALQGRSKLVAIDCPSSSDTKGLWKDIGEEPRSIDASEVLAFGGLFEAAMLGDTSKHTEIERIGKSLSLSIKLRQQDIKLRQQDIKLRQQDIKLRQQDQKIAALNALVEELRESLSSVQELLRNERRRSSVLSSISSVVNYDECRPTKGLVGFCNLAAFIFIIVTVSVVQFVYYGFYGFPIGVLAWVGGFAIDIIVLLILWRTWLLIGVRYLSTPQSGASATLQTTSAVQS